MKLTPVTGKNDTYDMTRADAPTETGTPVNKATLLQDSTAALYGLGGNAVPDDAFRAVYEQKTDRSRTITATLNHAQWQGSSPPYTYRLSITGVTATSNQDIVFSSSITASQLAAAQAANIQDGGQSAGVITLKAWGYKPVSDIPVRVILRRDT